MAAVKNKAQQKAKKNQRTLGTSECQCKLHVRAAQAYTLLQKIKIV
jgi:hypothetical protein